MKKLVFGISFLVLHALNVKSQCNLVPNPGFEIVTNCSMSGAGGIYFGYAPPWSSPTNGTTYLFNNCYPIATGTNVPFNGYGFQLAHSCAGYCNISTCDPSSPNYRQYIQVELDSALVLNEEYCISFYVNLADSTGIGTNNIGMYFSDTLTFENTTQNLNRIPQINYTNLITDISNWTEISGTYNAHGGERYIIIGNFYPDNLTDTVAIPTLRPWNWRYGYYFVDDVDVHRCSCNVGVDELKNEMAFNLIPNPNNGTMQLNYSLDNNESGLLKLYDIVGKEISEYRLVQGNTTLNINEEKLNNGLYIYKVIVNDRIVKSDKLVIVK